MSTSIVRRGLFLFLFVAVTVSAGSTGAQDDEREQLLERQKQLEQRIERLKRDQDYLLFEKTAYASDSKYLVLNVIEKTGQLRYKNRVLKEFVFIPPSRRHSTLRQGPLTLTAKIAAPRSGSALVFGKAFLFRAKGARGRADGGIPAVYLPRTVFLSLFSALETGARAYLLR